MKIVFLIGFILMVMSSIFLLYYVYKNLEETNPMIRMFISFMVMNYYIQVFDRVGMFLINLWR